MVTGKQLSAPRLRPGMILPGFTLPQQRPSRRSQHQSDHVAPIQKRINVLSNRPSQSPAASTSIPTKFIETIVISDDDDTPERVTQAHDSSDDGEEMDELDERSEYGTPGPSIIISTKPRIPTRDSPAPARLGRLQETPRVASSSRSLIDRISSGPISQADKSFVSNSEAGYDQPVNLQDGSDPPLANTAQVEADEAQRYDEDMQEDLEREALLLALQSAQYGQMLEPARASSASEPAYIGRYALLEEGAIRPPGRRVRRGRISLGYQGPQLDAFQRASELVRTHIEQDAQQAISDGETRQQPLFYEPQAMQDPQDEIDEEFLPSIQRRPSLPTTYRPLKPPQPSGTADTDDASGVRNASTTNNQVATVDFSEDSPYVSAAEESSRRYSLRDRKQKDYNVRKVFRGLFAPKHSAASAKKSARSVRNSQSASPSPSPAHRQPVYRLPVIRAPSDFADALSTRRLKTRSSVVPKPRPGPPRSFAAYVESYVLSAQASPRSSRDDLALSSLTERRLDHTAAWEITVDRDPTRLPPLSQSDLTWLGVSGPNPVTVEPVASDLAAAMRTLSESQNTRPSLTIADQLTNPPTRSKLLTSIHSVPGLRAILRDPKSILVESARQRLRGGRISLPQLPSSLVRLQDPWDEEKVRLDDYLQKVAQNDSDEEFDDINLDNDWLNTMYDSEGEKAQSSFRSGLGAKVSVQYVTPRMAASSAKLGSSKKRDAKTANNDAGSSQSRDSTPPVKSHSMARRTSEKVKKVRRLRAPRRIIGSDSESHDSDIQTVESQTRSPDKLNGDTYATAIRAIVVVPTRTPSQRLEENGDRASVSSQTREALFLGQLGTESADVELPEQSVGSDNSQGPPATQSASGATQSITDMFRRSYEAAQSWRDDRDSDASDAVTREKKRQRSTSPGRSSLQHKYKGRRYISDRIPNPVAFPSPVGRTPLPTRK